MQTTCVKTSWDEHHGRSHSFICLTDIYLPCVRQCKRSQEDHNVTLNEVHHDTHFLGIRNS